MISLICQGLPPIPSADSFDITRLLTNMGLAVLWTIVASICFAIAIAIGIRVLDALLPGLNKIEALKQGNMAVALLFATFIVSLTAIVVVILLK